MKTGAGGRPLVFLSIGRYQRQTRTGGRTQR
ncbi:hypothetical protein DES45_11069 [Microvirga subterranea]|uniref:Uncharacterized protein n=1 Tax=Microvirga subterranea TaxID=186651 RepID=A0A370HDJ0_9HYPH|nr:hypothetical protein DES45_11069 [Microvirga subterranea]